MLFYGQLQLAQEIGGGLSHGRVTAGTGVNGLMLCTIERTPFMWEKGRGDKCCPRPAACHVWGHYLGLVLSSSMTVRWVSRGTEAGWHAPMPSSWRDGSTGKWMCPHPTRGSGCARGCGCSMGKWMCFSSKLRQPKHRFSVGLKGCCQQHLPPNSGTGSFYTEAAKRAV